MRLSGSPRRSLAPTSSDNASRRMGTGAGMKRASGIGETEGSWPGAEAPAASISEAGAAADPEQLLLVVVLRRQHIGNVGADWAKRRRPQDGGADGGAETGVVSEDACRHGRRRAAPDVGFGDVGVEKRAGISKEGAPEAELPWKGGERELHLGGGGGKDV